MVLADEKIYSGIQKKGFDRLHMLSQLFVITQKKIVRQLEKKLYLVSQRRGSMNKGPDEQNFIPNILYTKNFLLGFQNFSKNNAVTYVVLFFDQWPYYVLIHIYLKNRRL